jgi:hypothetical protein
MMLVWEKLGFSPLRAGQACSECTAEGCILGQPSRIEHMVDYQNQRISSAHS